MTLLQHIYATLPNDQIWRKPEESYAIIQGDSFRLVYSRVDSELRIQYLRVSEQGKRHGDRIVEAVVDYCKEVRLTPFAIMPEEQYKHFWLRNGFEPTPDDDEKWIHEDWVA